MIFTFTKSIGPVRRIAEYLSALLGVEHVWDEQVAENKIHDRLIVIGGGSAFAGKSILAAAGKAIVEARRVVWVSCDYMTGGPKVETAAQSPYRASLRTRAEAGKEPVAYWSTVSEHAKRTEASRYVNWNALALNTECETHLYEDRVYPDVMVYYGYYRKERESAFERYFRKPTVRTCVSYPQAGKSGRWFSMYRDIMHREKFDDLCVRLSDFGLGLYLEDESSHRSFHSPANRFYEMLSAGLPMVFQPEAEQTMAGGGYNVKPYLEIPSVDTWRDVRTTQKRAWLEKAVNDRAEVATVVKAAWKELEQ